MTIKRMKKIFFPCLAVVFLFCACTGADGKIYGQQQVLEYVDDVCGESYQLVGRELISEDPDNMQYEFVTTERGITFTANSYLDQIWFDATPTGFYERAISCDYVEKVHERYRDDLNKVLLANEHYLEQHGWIYLLSFSDIDRAVDTILAADRVYARELEYNDEAFLSEHPLTTIHLVWQRSEEEANAHETWVNIADIGINGQHGREDLYRRLAEAYAQQYVDGEIENGEDIPEQYLANRHISHLETIELNGTEMLYDDEDNPAGIYGLTTDDYKYCWYNEEMGSYMMVADIGLISDSMSFPMINREYVKALGGTYRASENGDTYTASWTIGEDTWVLRSEFADNEIRRFAVEKNGLPLDISYITADEDPNVSARFCVGLTLEDFCKLFDLSCQVDEANEKVVFTGRQ